jgi:hypothetical protein
MGNEGTPGKVRSAMETKRLSGPKRANVISFLNKCFECNEAFGRTGLS